MSQLKANVIKNFSASFADLVLNKFLRLASEIIIINVLTKEEVGIWGVALSYIVFTNYLNVVPETILLRDFPKLQGNQLRLNQLISSYFNFNLLKNLIIVVVGLALFIWLSQQNFELALMLLALLIQRIVTGVIEMIKLIFYVSFEQPLVTAVGIVNNIIYFGILLLVLVPTPSLSMYAVITIFTSLLFLLVWLAVLRIKHGFSYTFNSRWLSDIRDNFREFTLWQHFNGSITQMVYNIDPWVLSFFYSYAAIGDYTVALKISNYFFILPMLIQKTAVQHYSHKTGDVWKAVRRYLAISFVISVGQLAGFVLFGRYITKWFFAPENTEQVYILAATITAGITILNIARPLIGLISVKYQLSRAFAYVYLPVGIVSLATYFLLSQINIQAVAFGNIINYSVFMILAVLFLVFGKRLEN